MDVGVEINQYVVVEHIGRGGMADVWSARDRRLNRTVAIKTVARDLSTDDDVNPVDLFKREAQTIARLEHPYILPVYDFGDYDNQLYIVMRYVTGGSLEGLIADGALEIDESLRIIRSVGHALHHAHENKVVHLDIKPSNILLDSNLAPYLADFGLAAVIDPEGRAANPGYGTLLYMAPEQLTQTDLDHRADIYSFTILVFHMLTGELPFDATTSLALKQLQFQEDLPDMGSISPDLPDALTPVLRRGTALNPDDRPNTVLELVNEIEAVLQPSAIAVSSQPEITVYFDPEQADVDEQEIGGTVDLSDVMPLISADEMAQREAVDLYNKARRAWAYGQGRFLLGITHFMLINDYYMQAESHELALDEAGMQMLLRGALEYDHEVDYWWNQLDDDNRRWVTLHAIRSDSPPARARALYRLVTLPDSDPPKIPTLVAQALQVERNEAAKHAAVHVLEMRANRQPARVALVSQNADDDSKRTTRARVVMQPVTASSWRESVYNH
ncbi:MAG: serine/threonine protein kinase, partial [Anaerolineae bacterium]|nr:serine/threonine protein kinase [Anaerolineae bacterium]